MVPPGYHMLIQANKVHNNTYLSCNWPNPIRLV